MQKQIIITGGAQGIGGVIASDLISDGYQVTVFDSDIEAIEEKKSDSQGIDYYQVDISDEEQIRNVISRADTSNLYAVINNAAISYFMPISQLTLDQWNRVLAVNLTAPFLLVKYTCKDLARNKGTVINIASTRALMSEAHTEAYSASKGGLISLTHAMAVSLGPEIRVNAISPGWIETRHLKKKAESINPVHSEADNLQHPVGRVGKARDISEMVQFLLSDKAGFITGQNFVVDGGMTRKMHYQ